MERNEADEYTQLMEEDHEARMRQCRKISKALKKSGIRLFPATIEAVMNTAENLGFIDWESWHET